jgi:hypothetical protein
MRIGSRSLECPLGRLYYEIALNIYWWLVECSLSTNIINALKHFVKNKKYIGQEKRKESLKFVRFCFPKM